MACLAAWVCVGYHSGAMVGTRIAVFHGNISSLNAVKSEIVP